MAESLESQVLAGGEAKYILEHGLVKLAFESLEADLKAQRLQVLSRDVPMHSELIRMEKTLESFRRYFIDTIATGEAAALDIEHKKTLAERFKDFTGVSRL